MRVLFSYLMAIPLSWLFASLSFADSNYYRRVLSSPEATARLKTFYENVFTVVDAERMMEILTEVHTELSQTETQGSVEEYYRLLQMRSSRAKAGLKKQLDSLRHQRTTMVRQTQMLFDEAQRGQQLGTLAGYLELGSQGRYVNKLREAIHIANPVYVMNTKKPSFLNPNDYAERVSGSWLNPRIYSSFFWRNDFVPLSGYDMIRQAEIASHSLSLISVYIGLHHAPEQKVRAFLSSLYRTLRPGGYLVLRDHDATPENLPFVWLAHSTYNAMLGVSWEEEQAEIRNFQPLAYWQEMMAHAGFVKVGMSLYQEGDPTKNGLMLFQKVQAAHESREADMPLQTPNYLERQNAMPRSMPSLLSPERLENQLERIGASTSIDHLVEIAHSLEGYSRESSATFMTVPEWALVEMIQQMGAFMEHTPWYNINFDHSVASFENYREEVADYARHSPLRDDQKSFAEWDAITRQLGMFIRLYFKPLQWVGQRITRSYEGEEAAPTTGMVIAASDTETLLALDPRIQLLKSCHDGGHILAVPRYKPFFEIVQKLVAAGMPILDVAGHNFIAVTIVSSEEPRDDLQQIAGVDRIASLRLPTNSERTISAYKVDLHALPRFINNSTAYGYSLHHIYDF